MSSAWPFIGSPRCRDDPTTGPPITHQWIRGLAKESIGAAMFDDRPVTIGVAHGSGRLALRAAATLDSVPTEEREIEMSLAQEMLSAAVSHGRTGPATIGPGTAAPSGTGGGEGRRHSATLFRRVQDRPRTEFA
jgi:hypothetical protein